MIKLNQAIIVEGKYDKIKLESLLDALIIDVNGFHIFKDKEKCELIKEIAKKTGIIIFTDSDNAGALIRNHINNIVKDGKVFNAYIPEILGKEKRKAKSSSQGFLGVEGVEKEIILNALKKIGVLSQINDTVIKKEITSLDLYNLGLSGKENSKVIKEKLLKRLQLPTNLSKNNMLKILSIYSNLNEITKFVEEIKEEIENGRQS